MDPVQFCVILAFIACTVAAYRQQHRELWRESLLMLKTSDWERKCNANSRTVWVPNSTADATCDAFAQCCQRFPQQDDCTQMGGILEPPVCNYFSRMIFGLEPPSFACECIRKYIHIDHKPKCQGAAKKTQCLEFDKCCRAADGAHPLCIQYDSEELERPQCKDLQNTTFNYDAAVCQCVIDAPGATAFMPNETEPPSTTPTTPTTTTTTLQPKQRTTPQPRTEPATPDPKAEHSTSSSGVGKIGRVRLENLAMTVALVVICG